MAFAYTTAQLDSIILGLERKLTSALEVRHGDKSVVNQAASDIRSSIAYFYALYNDASDAPLANRPRIRTYFAWGSKGFGGF